MTADLLDYEQRVFVRRSDRGDYARGRIDEILDGGDRDEEVVYIVDLDDAGEAHVTRDAIVTQGDLEEARDR